MRLVGRIEIGAFGADSKSARKHQAFLVCDSGERMLLRRYDGPAMRDKVLEAMAGQRVEAEGLVREHLLLAKSLKRAKSLKKVSSVIAPAPGKALSAASRKPKQKY